MLFEVSKGVSVSTLLAVTFGSIAAKTLGDAPFNLSATASSGLTVQYSTASDKITITGSQVALIKSGSVTIDASQSGNTNFTAATTVSQTLCINPAKPTVTASNVDTETPLLTSNSTSGNQWFLNGSAISGATSSTLTVSQVGIYKVQVIVDGCAKIGRASCRERV